MNISKTEQRVLHALAQGGCIRHRREGPHITEALCFNRDGRALAGFDLKLLARLRRRGLVASSGGGPYRISPLGRASVRSQPDNR